jgi:poly(A) polymerase
MGDVLADDSPTMELAGLFRVRGHELYLVGGHLRDWWLGRETSSDVDLATDAPPEATLEIVRPRATNLWLQGVRFGTVGAEVDGQRVEITTFRSERYHPESRHPEVAFEADIHSDLGRRDFTINALALRLPERELLDPFAGRADLEARLIRTPGDPKASLGDDPLRMLRAFRFASQLEFSIADEVLLAVTELKDQIRTVSAERVRDELSKLVIGKAPGAALALAEPTGLTRLFLPELSELRLEQDPVHRHKDVFAHTLAVVERTPARLPLRLAALLHDIGKPRTRRIGPEGVSFHHHEVVGAEMARRRLRALRYPNDLVDAVGELIRLHHRFHTYRLGWSDSAVRRYARDAGPLLEDLNRLVRADCTTRNRDLAKRLASRMDELTERIEDLAAREQLDRLRPELDGNEIMAILGVEPGPLVGEARSFLLDLRLDEGPVSKEAARERLLAWARERGLGPAPRPPE